MKKFLSILLVIVVAIALVIQAKVLNSGSYDIIKGKAMRPALMKLRGARYPMMLLSLVSLFIMVVMPFVCIIVVSFLKTFGMDPFQALQAITINPARHIGIADRVGSLEVGKDADVVLTDGNPFEISTRVQRVLIDGKTVYSAE